MRSLYLWPAIVIVIVTASGCCPGPRLESSQTPVAVAQDQRIVVRPLKGGESRRVTVPAGFVVVEPMPEDKQPELKR